MYRKKFNWKTHVLIISNKNDQNVLETSKSDLIPFKNSNSVNMYHKKLQKLSNFYIKVKLLIRNSGQNVTQALNVSKNSVIT